MFEENNAWMSQFGGITRDMSPWLSHALAGLSLYALNRTAEFWYVVPGSCYGLVEWKKFSV